MAQRDHARILNVPNAMTMLRLLLVPVFVFASLRGAFAVAFFAFVSAGITDIFDGYLARRLNQQSRFGALLDPAADKMMMISGYVLFTFLERAQYRLPISLTFTVFIRDFLITCFAYLLYTRVQIKRFPPSWAGKLSTVCQVVALSVTIAANSFLAPLAVPLLTPLLYLALGMTLFSGFDYLRRWNEYVLSN
jgi:cardiolipin synthase